MKLYTEEQLYNSMYKLVYPFSDGKEIDEIITKLTPIKLPSDEEIGQQFKNYSEDWEIRQALEVGAQWMRDKILNK